MTVPDYRFILSKARGPNGQPMVLAASANNTDVVLAVRNYQNMRHLWVKEPRGSDPNTFALKNRETGTYLARASADNGAAIVLISRGDMLTNNLAGWSNDTVPGEFNALASAQDWEQKINIMGNGPYGDGARIISWEWSRAADNELWCFVPANSTAVLKRIDFNLSAGTLQDLPPNIVTQQIIRNDTDLEQSQTIEYEATHSKTETYSASAALELSVAYSVEVGAPVGIKTSLTLGAKVTTSISFGVATTNTETVKISTPVRVPPHSTLTIRVVVQQAKIDVPFIAVYDLTYADGTVVQVQREGIYNQVTAYNAHTVFDPVQPISPVPPIGARIMLENSAHNKQLGATPPPENKAYVHTNTANWEQWRVEDAGNGQVFLRSDHGTYLRSDQNGKVDVTPNRDAWERWSIIPATEYGDLVLVRSVTWGRNLGATNTDVLYTHTNSAEWERWRAVIVPGI